MNQPVANIELLVQIASQTGHPYADAYTIWEIYRAYPDAYSIVDTVLWVAQNQGVSVVDAIKTVQDIEEQFGSSTNGV
ncbi:hypothetical protein EXU85_01885 [Spirosoma sp. KCTC 42546]|uniref:hypothetical protein n=1 Tax=Spirosoma sp. KCTC 42546 TaxID=2520506 RepID=UPI0011589177|nr:hypothetical protein [Spirosoma sp. KCTC 42546]QDK77411.1 hypothetical protein EXU85_01885 [Spirosoma sp. KCTC 42546]